VRAPDDHIEWHAAGSDASAAVREQLDEAAFEAAWGKGRAMSLEEAVAYALGSEK